jgi:hypothetical protein
MSSHCARRIALTLACWLLPGTVAAQYAAAPGARVRVVNVSSSAPVLTGRLMRIAGDTVTISSAGAIQTALLLTPEHRLEVSAGTHGRTLRGIGLGFLTGAAVGAAVGLATYKKSDCTGLCVLDFGPGATALAGAVLVSVPGMLIGGIVGANVTRETWRLVEHRPIRVGVAPAGHRGVLLTLSLPF